MPTIKTGKHLGPVVGAALILGAAIPAATADCSKTENGDVADKTKVVFSNESHSTPFTVRFYKHYAGTNDYGDPIETTTVAMGEKANHQFDVSNYKDGSDKVDENTIYVKITLEAGENSSIVASCEYNVKNDKSCEKGEDHCVTSTTWNWSGSCSDDDLQSTLTCANCETQCTKKFDHPNGKPNIWTTTFHVTE